MRFDNRRIVGQIASDVIHLSTGDTDSLRTVKEWHGEFERKLERLRNERMGVNKNQGEQVTGEEPDSGYESPTSPTF